jgi:hypothetical protein
MDLNDARWRKSSHSGDNGGQCVELAQLPGVIGIRDSKNPAAAYLAVTTADLGALFGRIKAGELEL